MAAKKPSTSSVRARMGLKKTSTAKGDMGGVRGPGTGGRASHPTATRKNIKNKPWAGGPGVIRSSAPPSSNKCPSTRDFYRCKKAKGHPGQHVYYTTMN